MTDNKKISLNIIANVITFVITIFISLFITPYIVGKLGGEAYGFVGLANNFVSYATLATIAINSMSSRFVSISIYQNDYEEANKYFTSVMFANVLLAIIAIPVLTIIVWKLEKIIEIPENLLIDVKITFALTFFQFVVSVLLSRYEIATFVTNRLYLTQRNSIISSVMRLMIIVICFKLFSAHISFMVLGSVVGAWFGYIMNLYYTKKFLPELKVKVKYYDFKCIKNLILAGVWNLVNKMSSILLDGLDLLLSNVFIGAAEMGALAISKTIPAMFFNLRGTLDYPFTPPMTKCYAQNDIDGVIKNCRMGNKILGIFMIAPMAAFAIYGQSFFKLWVPTEDSFLIHMLALLAILNLLAGACINSVFTIFSVTNKLKIPSLVMFGTGIFTVIINLILLKFTNLGVYVIAGTSSVLSLLRNYIFTPLYGAHCLNVKKTTFYHEIITGNICLAVNLAVGFILYKICIGATWLSLIVSAGCMAVICIVINFFIVLSKDETRWALSQCKKWIDNKKKDN